MFLDFYDLKEILRINFNVIDQSKQNNYKIIKIFDDMINRCDNWSMGRDIERIENFFSQIWPVHSLFGSKHFLNDTYYFLVTFFFWV